MRTRWLTMILVGMLAIPLAGVAQNAAKKTEGKPSGRPILDLERMNYDFGETFEQKEYAYSFIVRNKGTADLVIEDVHPGCGCTAAKWDKVIAPGKTGKIDLVIDGAKVSGQFSKTTEVKTNDPDHPQVTLVMSGREIPIVRVTPEGTVYLHGRPGEAVEKELTIATNEKDIDFQVTGLKSNMDDKITYSYAKGTKPGEYVIKVKKDAKLPIMSTYGTLTVTTNSKKSPETTLQVHVMTKSSILVSPSVLNYGQIKFADAKGPGTQSTKTLTVTKAAGKIRITEVTSSNPNFKPTLETVVPDQQYKVTVVFIPPTRKQSKQTESGEMILKTNDPQEPTLRVQLVARSEI
ncbi:MAG TPA: DUF1573 domain-containing protein [Candidatus Krumholzibacteria bacterium]